MASLFSVEGVDARATLAGLVLLSIMISVWYLRIHAGLAAKVAGLQRGIEERDALNRAMVERSNEGMVMIRDDRVVMANPVVLTMLGLTEAEVLRRPFIQFVHADCRHQVMMNYLCRISGKQAPQRYATVLLHREGGRIEVEVSAIPLSLDGSTGALAVFHPPSNSRHDKEGESVFESRPAAANRTSREVLARSRSMRRQVSAALRSKREFLANMSSELRMPLGTIVGMTDLLMDQAFGPVTASQRESLCAIQEDSQQLLDLLDHILDMARLESGSVELVRTTVDLRAFCSVCMRYIRLQAAGRGVNTTFECIHGADTVWADPRRLRQVLINLLGNAVKFTQDGGGVALVVAPVEGGGVRFSVSDTGIGIPLEKQAGIFEPFERVDSSLSRKHGGAGLGLSIAQRVVAMHGGTIEVKSTFGKGSTFTVVLPGRGATLHETPETGSEAEGRMGSPGSRPFSGCRILIAEDDEPNARLLEHQLTQAGAITTVVVNGSEAVDRARAMQPSLILLAVRLSGVNGIEVTRAVKRDPLTAGIPVICLADLAIDEDRDRCLAAGADDILIKPAETRTLISTLLRQLAGSQAPDMLA